MEAYIEEAKKLGLQFYQPSETHDVLLFKWWMKLYESGELTQLFSDYHRSLSNFFNFLTPPCRLIFKLDDNDQIIFAVWFVPVSDSDTSAFMGYWAHKNFRSTREHLRISNIVYTLAFKIWKVIVGVTKHEDLLRIHRKLGYNIVGTIPHFLDDQEVWIVYLTEENFKQSPLYKAGERLHGKQ